MTKRTGGFKSSSPPTTSSASPLMINVEVVRLTPRTRGAVVLQSQKVFRPQDVPIPEGFEDIDHIMEARERTPKWREGIVRARRRIFEKLFGSKAHPSA